MPKLFIPASGRIVCNVKIRPYNSPILRNFEFKIDTGADISTISKETLYSLGYTEKWITANKKPTKGSTTVAFGEVIESFYVEPKKLDYRLLLGNDILSCFIITIDRDNGFVNMERRSSLDSRNKNYPNSQLNYVETEIY